MSNTYRGKSLRKGGGGRFLKLEDALSRKGVENPGALDASIGREKYGDSEFKKMMITGINRHYREERNK